MENKEKNSLNFNNIPEISDKEGWAKYAEEADKFVKHHTQTNEADYGTFGKYIAGRALQRFINSSARMSRAYKLEAPEIMLEHLRKSVTRDVDSIGEINHEDIAKLRATLAELPANTQHLQNQIFTNLMNESGSRFILETIRPSQLMKKGADTTEERFLQIMLGIRTEKVKWYDFIGKLTETDADGKPTISDELFQNFFEWYQASLAAQQHKLNAERPKDVAEYSDGVENAVNEGHLPECFVKNLDFFEPDSPRAHNLNFSLFDMMDVNTSAVGVYSEHMPIDRDAPIGVRVDAVVGNDKYRIIWHELTHAAAGDIIDFGNNEANRIVNEALTEHISHMISKSGDGMFPDDDDFDFMSGDSYARERDVVMWLASSGNKTVPPNVFYEAYAEYDPKFEEVYNDFVSGYINCADDNGPKPEVGPKKEALFSALLEAFPDCKDVEDLGKLIIKKFKEKKTAA